MVIINYYNEQAIPTILNFKTYALYTLTNFHKQLKSVISVEFGTPWKNGTTTCVAWLAMYTQDMGSSCLYTAEKLVYY